MQGVRFLLGVRLAVRAPMDRLIAIVGKRTFLKQDDGNLSLQAVLLLALKGVDQE